MSDSDLPIARTKLEFIYQETLRDVETLTARLEAVSGQLNAATAQLESVPAAAKKDMTAIAVQLVKAAQGVAAQNAPTAAVTLSLDGGKAVLGAVDTGLKRWTPDLIDAINKAESIGEVKAALKEIARVQGELLLQQQKKEGTDWRLVGTIAAACLLASLVSGVVSAWMVKPAPAVGQDLTLESGIPAAKSGQKIDAGKQEQR